MTLAKAITKTLDIDVEDVRIDLTATIKSYDLTDTKFIFDIQSSNGLTIDLTGSTAMYIVEYVHNSQTYAIQGDVNIIGTDTLSFNLPEDLKGYKGTVLIGIYVKLTDGTKIDIKDIAVRIEPSIMDKDIDFSAKAYFKDFESIKAEVILEGEKAKTEIKAALPTLKSQVSELKSDLDNQYNIVKKRTIIEGAYIDGNEVGFLKSSTNGANVYVFYIEPGKEYKLISNGNRYACIYTNLALKELKEKVDANYAFSDYDYIPKEKISNKGAILKSDSKSTAVIYTGINSDCILYDIQLQEELGNKRGASYRLDNYLDYDASLPYELMSCVIGRTQRVEPVTDKSNKTIFVDISSISSRYISVFVKGSTRFRICGMKTRKEYIEIGNTLIEDDVIILDDNIQTEEYIWENTDNYNTLCIYVGNVDNAVISIKKYSIEHEVYKHKEIIDKINKSIEEESGLLEPLSYSIPSTAIEYHELWDKFVDDGFATRTLLGTVNEQPIYEYQILTSKTWIDTDDCIEYTDDTLYTRPKIAIDSGIHGNERATPVWLYNFIYNLCYNLDYADLLVSFDWYIIPLVNPNGFNADTRTNYDGADINRDCYTLATEEGRIMKSFLDRYDYDFFFDFHLSEYGYSYAQPNKTAFLSTPYEDDTEKMNLIYKKFMQAAMETELSMCKHLNKEFIQTIFPWKGTNNPTWRNYAKDHATYSMCFEVTQATYHYSGSDTRFNSIEMMIGNTLLDKTLKNILSIKI